MPNKLRREALEWALGHVDLEGDTDLSPRPFEIDALRTAWRTLAAELENIDIANHRWQPARKFLLLKDEQSFRNVSQLDPLDALLFAAIAWEIGEHIERHRSPLLDETVFSYRFNPTPAGHLYGEEGHWNAFWRVSVHRAYHSNYVAVTDLTDFYNQISHHAIEHELDACGAGQHLKAAVKNLLKEFTQGDVSGDPNRPSSFSPACRAVASTGRCGHEAEGVYVLSLFGRRPHLLPQPRRSASRSVRSGRDARQAAAALTESAQDGYSLQRRISRTCNGKAH